MGSPRRAIEGQGIKSKIERRRAAFRGRRGLACIGKNPPPVSRRPSRMSKEKSRRVRERLQLALPVRVRGRDNVGYEWTEMTRLLDVTPFGAGFQLKRLVQQGRLVQLRIGMPRQLRCYD